VALQYGPLIYNIEKVDQDISKALAPASPLTTEFRKDLLGGVVSSRARSPMNSAAGDSELRAVQPRAGTATGRAAGAGCRASSGGARPRAPLRRRQPRSSG